MRFGTFMALVFLITNILTGLALYHELATVTPVGINVDHCEVGQPCHARVTTR